MDEKDKWCPDVVGLPVQVIKTGPATFNIVTDVEVAMKPPTFRKRLMLLWLLICGREFVHSCRVTTPVKVDVHVTVDGERLPVNFG